MEHFLKERFSEGYNFLPYLYFMKHFTFLLVVCLSTTTFGQSNLFWSQPMVVSTQQNVFRPRIDLVNGNIPVIVWGHSSDRGIYFSKEIFGNFTGPQLINPAREAFLADWTGPEIAASGDTIYVVFSSYPGSASESYLIRSFNGGNSFSDTIRVDSLSLGEMSRFPSVAIRPGGNPVINYMIYAPTGEEYATVQSFDGGTSFLPKKIASAIAPGSVCDCCPAQPVVDGDRQVLLFRNNDNNKRNIWAALSTDEGSTFSLSKDIDQTDWIINACPSTGPDGFIHNDTIWTVWASAADGKRKVYFSSSSMNDLTMTSRKTIFDMSASGSQQNFPRIAGHGDTIGVVWQHLTAGKSIILFSYSVSGFAGIGATIDTVSTVALGQINPDIAFANGVFHITFTDFYNGHIIYRKAGFLPVGITETKQEQVISIFPNPASDKITVSLDESSGQATIAVYNILGVKVFEERMYGNSKVIQTDKFEKGTFFVKVMVNGKEEYVKQVQLH